MHPSLCTCPTQRWLMPVVANLNHTSLHFQQFLKIQIIFFSYNCLLIQISRGEMTHHCHDVHVVSDSTHVGCGIVHVLILWYSFWVGFMMEKQFPPL